jgi:hypothetical protein
VSAAKAARANRKPKKTRFNPDVTINDPTSESSKAKMAAHKALQKRREEEEKREETPASASLADIGIKPAAEREREMRRMGMLRDVKTWEELDQFKDLNPASQTVKQWKSMYSSNSKSLQKAKEALKNYQKEYDWDYKDVLSIKLKSLRSWQKRINEVLHDGKVSDTQAKKWKKTAVKATNRLKIETTRWPSGGHSLDPAFTPALQNLRFRMTEFAGTKFYMHADDMILLGRVAGMPQDMVDEYETRRDHLVAPIGVYTVGVQKLEDDLQRTTVALSARQVMDRAAKTDTKAAKKAKRKLESEIKVKSKAMRGRSRSVEPKAKRSRTKSPPKNRKRSTSPRKPPPKPKRQKPSVSSNKSPFE